MIFNNPQKIGIFSSFLSQYGSQVDALWPQIQNYEMEVIDTQHWSPILSGCVANYRPENVCDTPFFSFIGIPTNPVDVVHFIGINNSCVATLNLTPGEMYALIMHEIGHLIAYVNAGCKPIFSQNVSEEFFPDDCAKMLGLGNEIRSVLQTMSQSFFYTAEKQREFISRRNRL